MAGAIPLQRLHHANVVVHDLQATARGYARLLGITRWQVRHHTPQRLQHTQARGYRMEFGYSTATGSNAHGVTFRLVQPTHGFSTFTEHLITRGEGVHSLCVTLLDPAQLDALVARLPEHGLRVAQAASLEGVPSSVLVDTRQPLGGFLMELASPAGGPVDAEWDLSSEDQRPAAVDWLARIPKVGHFGVAVSNLAERAPHYATLLGIEHWHAMHFHRAPGSLEYSTVQGKPVDNAWIIAITDVADFGVELLQGTREPTDYRQTIERSGEGIHHMLVRRDVSDQDWWALRAWMESMNIGTVMSGRVRSGAAEFFYLDTRAALGGYLLEVIVAHEVSAGGSSSGSGTPDPLGRFALDFSAPAC